MYIFIDFILYGIKRQRNSYSVSIDLSRELNKNGTQAKVPICTLSQR